MPADRIVYGAFSWQFVAIRGVPQLPDANLQRIKKRGVDGAAYLYVDREAEPSTLTLEAAALNQADEESWIASMSNLVGLQVTVYTSTGVSYGSLVVTACRHLASQAVAVGKYGAVSLGSTGRLLTFEMVVEYPYGVA